MSSVVSAANAAVHRCYTGRVERVAHRSGLYPYLYGCYQRAIGLAHRPTTATVEAAGTAVDLHTVHDSETVSVLHTRRKESALIEAFGEAIRPDDVVLDVGANLGVYSCLGAALGERAVGVEPHPATAARARENLALNDLGDHGAIREVALWDRPGERQLATDRNEVGTQTPAVVLDGGDLSVPAVRGDDLDVEPDVVKIDVEGAENAVISGLVGTLASARVVFVEDHGTDVGLWFPPLDLDVDVIDAGRQRYYRGVRDAG